MNKIKKSVIGLFLINSCFLSFSLYAKPYGSSGENFLFKVDPGTTLEGLAKTYTFNNSNWKLLQDLNKIEDPYKLPIGSIVKIPLSLIPTEPSTAEIIYTKGNIQSNSSTISKGYQIQENSILVADNDSFATIQLPDYSQITLLPNTSIEFKQLKKFSGTGITDSVLDINKGSIESDVAPNGEGVGRFEIRTPITITGVRGTKLNVYKDDKGSTHVVTKGSIDTESLESGDKLNIATGHASAYSADGNLLGLRKILPAPEIKEAKNQGGAWLIEFESVPNAVAYNIKVSSDENGMLIDSSYTTDELRQVISSSKGGQQYVFVQAIDNLGLGGNSASLTLEFPWGIVSSDGLPVLSGFGIPIQRQSYN